ncbi:MAG: secondary thiamine-phosphate synthase enzyme YjbQ [candidate division Zixibacteria bacterium]|nr:secondary thiamine-phosphate synthase enzyme YjbQ [candidate division Zixibacteria bacterium]
MSILTRTFKIKTKGNTDILNITSEVQKIINGSGLKEGQVLVFVPGSTAGITTVEYEPGLLKDLPLAYDRIVPQDIEYAHHLTWGDHNGHAHVRAAFLGASKAFPFSDGELLLGTWQQIVLIDFDEYPRSREIVVQLIGA